MLLLNNDRKSFNITTVIRQKNFCLRFVLSFKPLCPCVDCKNWSCLFNRWTTPTIRKKKTYHLHTHATIVNRAGRFFIFNVSLSIAASNVTSLLQKSELSGYQVDNSSLIKRLILIVCMLKLSTGGDFYFFSV